MKEEKISQESFNLVQQELITLTERLEEIGAKVQELDDLRLEIKGLKLFLARLHPDFSVQFQEIMKKVMKK
jgi:hypothetical protein